MAESTHRGKHQPLTQTQNNRMSDDPGDGSRLSDRTGADGAGPQDGSPEERAQEEPEALETFGEAGAGLAAKE